MINKELLLTEAKQQLNKVIKEVKDYKGQAQATVATISKRLNGLGAVDKLVESRVLSYNEQRVHELVELEGSPYFTRCDILFDGEKDIKSYYFSKFSLSEKNIYSWFTPIAGVRFEDVGRINYRLPNQRIKPGILLRKDQFMITSGKIMFMAHESQLVERQLIYQEYLSNRKAGFVLPEIIEKMEKSQDKVIRAQAKGSFLISGPAGSGKTTLALHRAAYLTQAPDTSINYPGESIIVFVQDQSTQDYFSNLLPQLGINNVKITTFETWAFKILKLEDYNFVFRFGDSETERDLYEYRKNLCLKNHQVSQINYSKNIFIILKNIYQAYFDDKNFELLKKQEQEKRLDRFDVAILLKLFANTNQGLKLESRCVEESRSGKLSLVNKLIDLQYSLIIVDEVQNYLSLQIELMQSCVSPKTKSMLYVGDLAQQTKIGTIRNFSEINEVFEETNLVQLDKVYRNTQEILLYARGLGYEVVIPDKLRTGEIVEEYSKTEALERITEIIKNNSESMIGILGFNHEQLDRYLLLKTNKVKVLTINEAQGAEFEVVCLIQDELDDSKIENYPQELIVQKQQLKKDLLYVAITRAMNKLYVFK